MDSVRWGDRLRASGVPAVPLVHVVDLVTALLRIANATPAATKADHRRAELHGEIGLLEDAIVDALRAHDSEYVDDAIVEAVASALDARALAPGIAALTAAHVIDARLGARFIDYFRPTSDGSRDRHLRAGDPIPVVPFPAETVSPSQRDDVLRVMGRRSGNPDFRTTPDDRVAHLRLAPAGIEEWHVLLRWADPHVEPIGADCRFAAGITNGDFQGDFQWERYEVQGRPMFYAVTPRRPDDQLGRLRGVLAEALDREAKVLVLPELCATGEMIASLRRSPELARIPLAALGSYHDEVEPGAPGRNRCHVIAHGREIAVHEKFTDFHYDDGGTRRHEHLVADETSGFSLLVSPQCTVVPLICKDALDVRVQELVRTLAPTLVLIPAMSEDVEGFLALARMLRDDPQSFTIVSCITPGAAGVIGRPTRKRYVIARKYSKVQAFVVGLDGRPVDAEPTSNQNGS